MISRRYRIQEKRTTRRAFLLILASIGLLLALLFFGIPILVRFAALVGDLKSSSSPILQEDKTPPAPPYINQQPAYTQEGKITLTGVAEAGSNLQVFKNSESIKEVIVDDSSSFSLEVNLSLGENRIIVTATDKAGNKSEPSGITIIYDKEPPLLEVGKPADGESFFGDNKTISVEGRTENGARVIVNDRVAVIDAEGNFSQTVTLSEGENTINIRAVDEAGNETEQTLMVSYTS